MPEPKTLRDRLSSIKFELEPVVQDQATQTFPASSSKSKGKTSKHGRDALSRMS